MLYSQCNGEVLHISSLDEWKDKFWKENGTAEEQIIQQAENPTTYKNKIKQWIKDNPKPE